MSNGRVIIVDYRLSDIMTSRLLKLGEVISFKHPCNIGALQGHPDICIFYNNKDLIVATDTPKAIFKSLKRNKIPYRKGDELSGPDHPALTTYNAAGTEELLIHNTRYSSNAILDLYPAKEIIDVKQGYTRCSTLMLDRMHLITSDAGIAKKCTDAGREVLFVEPKEILLPGLEYGLFGGCCGISGDTVLIAGSLKYLPQGKEIASFIKRCGRLILELNDSVPQDVGGIFVLGEPL